MNSVSTISSNINEYKYSVKESGVPGTFFHKMSIFNIPDNFENNGIKKENFQFKGYKEVRIDKLSENEKLEGWRRVLPNFVVREEEIFRNKNNIKVRKKIRHLSTLHINLSQVPNHLWKKIKTNYKENNIISYYTRDKIYKYYIKTTAVDDKIKKLHHLLKFSKVNKKLLKSLLNDIKKENISKGWIILKGEDILNSL
jgi:hypothetical protein